MKKLLTLLLLIAFAPNALGAECPAPETEEAIPTEGFLISAVYPNPNSGEAEWVELSNESGETLDLSLYTLEDATAKPWTLSGTLEETLRIDGFPFQLNNSNETVTLKTIEGITVDSFSYASSSKGVPISRERNSAAPEEETATSTVISTSSASVTVTPSLWPIFSEALPNPEGSDSTNEWIELYNPYGESLELSGLRLDDSEGGSSPYALSGSLAAESYLLLSVSETKITLNNDTDHLRLLGVNGEIFWDITYTDSKEGNSYAFFETFYDWTEEPSPGTENTWAGETATEEDEDAEPESPYENGDLSDEVAVTEVFPNPEGPDTEKEWIELTNNGNEPVNLGNWTLDDGEGGSDPFTFPDDTIIEPGETLILYRTETGIALNNSNETVQLSDYTGETMSEINYETSEEGESYSEIQIEEVESLQASASGLGNQVFSTWQWVTPSPGALNPVWKQVKGEILEFDGSLLTLFDGVSTWTFKVAEQGSLDPLIYGIGNQVLIQASSQNGLFEIMHGELIYSQDVKEPPNIPWSFIGSAALILAYLIYEALKHRKKRFQMA